MTQPPERRRSESLGARLAAPSPIGSECFLLILLSLADLLMTHRLLSHGGAFYEANPVARWVFDRWNIAGMTVYKFALIGVIVVIGETVERTRPGWGRAVILFGCVMAAYAFFQGFKIWLHHA